MGVAGGAELALPVYAEAGHWELVHDVAASLDSAIRDEYLLRYLRSHQSISSMQQAIVNHLVGTRWPPYGTDKLTCCLCWQACNCLNA